MTRRSIFIPFYVFTDKELHDIASRLMAVGNELGHDEDEKKIAVALIEELDRRSDSSYSIEDGKVVRR